MDTLHENLVTTDEVPFLSGGGAAVYALRLDKLHPVISGNKWYKLRYHIEEARRQGKRRIVTFGGAYSNHIVATAAACKLYGFKSTGIIRGEMGIEPSQTLSEAVRYGMELCFLSRSDYKLKNIPAALYDNDCDYFIPEGGYSVLGMQGAATIPYDKGAFDMICCAVGTGTMLAGLLHGKLPGTKVLGISVLKNHHGLADEVRKLVGQGHDVQIDHRFHFGGYAKRTEALTGFMNKLYAQSGIPTDFVYTAKLFYAVRQLGQEGFFRDARKILVVHSGGLQGNRSLPPGTLIF
ncbi:MAG: pyridoxal-phosphate dependent enzyme [Niabella sp.]